MNAAYHPAPQGGRTMTDETSIKESFRPIPREEKQDTPKPDLRHPADIEQTYPGTNVDNSEVDSGMTSLKERDFRLQAAGVNIGAQNETPEMNNLKHQIRQYSSSSNAIHVVCVFWVGKRTIYKDNVTETIVDSNKTGEGEGKKDNTEQSMRTETSMLENKCKTQEQKDRKMEEKGEDQNQTFVKETYLQREESSSEVEKQDVEKSETSPDEKENQTEVARTKTEVRTKTESDAEPHRSPVMLPNKGIPDAEPHRSPMMLPNKGIPDAEPHRSPMMLPNKGILDAKPHRSPMMLPNKGILDAEQKLSDKSFIVHREPKAAKDKLNLINRRLARITMEQGQESMKKEVKKMVYVTEAASKREDAMNHKESQPEEKEVDMSEGRPPNQTPGVNTDMETEGQKNCPGVEICTGPNVRKDVLIGEGASKREDAINKESRPEEKEVDVSEENFSDKNVVDAGEQRHFADVEICTDICPKQRKEAENEATRAAPVQKLSHHNNSNNKNNNSSKNSDVLNTLYRYLTRRCVDKRMMLVYEINLHHPDNIQIAYKLEDGPPQLPTPKERQAGGKMEEEMSKVVWDLLENEKGEKKPEGDLTHPVDTDPECMHPDTKCHNPAHPEMKQPTVTESKVAQPNDTQSKVTQSKVKHPKVKHPKVKHPKVKHPKVKHLKVTQSKVTPSDDASTVKQFRGSSKRRSARSKHWRHGQRRTKKNKHRKSFYKQVPRDQAVTRDVPVDDEKLGPSHACGSGDRKGHGRSTQSNKSTPGGASGAGSPVTYSQPPHHPNTPTSSTRPARRRSHTRRNGAAIAKTATPYPDHTPYPDQPSSGPGSIQTVTVRRRVTSENPARDSEAGSSSGGSVGRGRPCSNSPTSPPGGNTGAIGGGHEQHNGLSNNGDGDQGKDGSSGSQGASQQSRNQGSQKGGEAEKGEDSGRDGGRGEKGGGEGGSGDGQGGREEEGEAQREETVRTNGPVSIPHPWPPPAAAPGVGVGAPCGAGARPKVKPAVCYTKKKPAQDHCQGPYRDHYRLLQSKRARAASSREDVNRAFSELEKCLVKCLHRDKDKQCAACGLIHAVLKHVAKCSTSVWTECRDCSPVADLLIYHVEVCLAHTYAAPSGAASADQGRVCRNNLKLCRNLVYKIKDRCAKVAPHEQTRHTFRHAIEEVWRTPGVWARIKTYLRKVFDISLALNDSPPEALQSGLGDQLVSVPNFFSVRIASIRDTQQSILSSVALQQIIAAGNETEDPAEIGQEFHSGYSSCHEWEVRAQPSDNVKYGDQGDLIAIGERWRQQKESRSRPGCSTKHTREEDEMEQGVIMAHHARDMMVQYPGGRYKRGTQWELGPVLGAGMSGRCSLALDLNTGFKFCVKEVILDKFELTEMEILTRLRHPGICLCYGAVLIGDSIYMFMEYVEGCSLQSHITGLTRLNDMTALVYFKQLIEVLHYLQGQGILHEDIKSENILLRSGTTRLVLIDFGLARQVPPAYPQVAANEPPVGSQTQWSPEKAECRGYGFPSDVWAASCVLLEMVTGSPPWLKRYSQAASLIYVIPMNAPPLADIHDYVSQTMRELIVWLWTMDPEQRPVPSDILRHHAFSMIDTSIINRVIKNRSILTSGSQSPIDMRDNSNTGRNNTVSIGSTTAPSGEVSPIERQTSSSSSSSSSNDATRCPSSLMSLVEDVKTVSTPRDPSHRVRSSQSVSTTSSMAASEHSVVVSGASVPLQAGNRLNSQPESQLGSGTPNAATESHTAGSPSDACDTAPHGSTTATPTHHQSAFDVNVQAPVFPVTMITPVPLTTTNLVPAELGLPNLSIFDQHDDSFQSSGSSVDLEKLMREVAGDAAAGSDDEFNDIQIHSSHSSRPDMGMPGCSPRAAADTSGLSVEGYIRDRKSSGRQSQSDSDIQSEYRELQNGLITRAASDHPSLLDDDWEDLREETEAIYSDAPHTTHDSMTPSQNPPAAATAAVPAEVEAGGVLVVFVDHETRVELCQLRMYHIAEWDKVVRTASSRIQPRFQDGYCVRPVGESILDLSTSLSMNVPVIQLEVWDYTGKEDWYVKDYQIMYSPHYMGAFMPQ